MLLGPFKIFKVIRPQVLAGTNPIFYCNFFMGLNKTVLGYFGLPLLYMVPQADWSRHPTETKQM